MFQIQTLTLFRGLNLALAVAYLATIVVLVVLNHNKMTTVGPSTITAGAMGVGVGAHAGWYYISSKSIVEAIVSYRRVNPYRWWTTLIVEQGCFVALMMLFSYDVTRGLSAQVSLMLTTVLWWVASHSDRSFCNQFNPLVVPTVYLNVAALLITHSESQVDALPIVAMLLPTLKLLIQQVHLHMRSNGRVTSTQVDVEGGVVDEEDGRVATTTVEEGDKELDAALLSGKTDVWMDTLFGFSTLTTAVVTCIAVLKFH